MTKRMAEIKINEKERKCLKSLVEVQEEGWCKFFATIKADTGLTKKEVRRAVRALSKKGFAEYVKGLLDEDGDPGYFGSGYCATRAGINFLTENSPKKLTHL